MNKSDKLFIANFKAKKYQANLPQIDPQIKNYWKALKEIWQTKKSTNDYQILEKYGLGTVNHNTSSLWYSSNQNLFNYNYQLKQLNRDYTKQIKL
jgi:hypothetical protein